MSLTHDNQTEGRTLLLRKKEKKILHYLNTCHVNIKFTIELEENSAIPFLDILITRSTDHTFSRKSLIKWPRPCRFYEPARLSTPNKPLFSRNRWSAKPGLGRCYLCLCSSPLLLRSSSDGVKMLLSKNGYSKGVVNYNINDVNKPRNPTAMVRACYPPPPKKKKKKIRLVLPYLGLQSKIIIKQLKACINIFYGCIDLRVIFPKHTSYEVSFPLQRQAQPFSDVQRASCCDCQDFYIGKTKRRLRDRKTEHFKTIISALSIHISTFPKLATKSTRF